MNDAAVQTGLPVMPVTRAPTATVCIHVPMFDTRLPVQTRANRRCRSGRRETAAYSPSTSEMACTGHEFTAISTLERSDSSGFSCRR